MYHWWPNQPVLEVHLTGAIDNREQAYSVASTVVREIEASVYPHVVVILDLTALKKSPSAVALLAGSLPETIRIEHLILIGAPALARIATLPFKDLREKIHFVSRADTPSLASQLLPRLPA